MGPAEDKVRFGYFPDSLCAVVGPSYPHQRKSSRRSASAKQRSIPQIYKTRTVLRHPSVVLWKSTHAAHFVNRFTSQIKVAVASGALSPARLCNTSDKSDSH